MNSNLFDCFFSDPSRLERRVLETRDGGDLSYADLAAAVGSMSNALVSAGLRPGDRLAAQVEKSVAAFVLYLATVRAGGVFLPLNTAYVPAEVDYFISDAEPVLVVADPGKLAGLEPIAERARAGIFTLDRKGEGSLAAAARAEGADFRTVPRAGDDVAAILYTSGTTGRSKGAMITHANLVSNAFTLRELWRFTPADVLLHALPIYHVHGLFTAANTILAAGASMIFQPAFNAGEVLAALPRATTMMGVPTFYTSLLQEKELGRESTRSIRLFISGSAPLLADTHRAWEARTGHAILERYGMTETGMNTSNPYEGERRPGTVGFPLPGVDVRITDPQTGEALAAGEIGMIEVRGPNVFKGYWRMPEKTASEFRPDSYFITGDLGRIDAGGYVHIVGRNKDLIITGGLNVYPKEVESVIDALPGVLESAVIGVPHPHFGEGVTAVVVEKPGAVLSEAGILLALSAQLAKFKLPKRVIFVGGLPRNAMGKVQKNVLREKYADLYSVAAEA